MKISWITGFQDWAYNNMVLHLIKALPNLGHAKNEESGDVSVLVCVNQLKNVKTENYKKTILHIDGNRWYEETRT